jgi:hypothetical protein
VGAFYLQMGSSASLYCTSLGVNNLSPLLNELRTFHRIRFQARYKDITLAAKVRELFQDWRGEWVQDKGEGACNIPVKDTQGHSFTVSGDGSVQTEGKFFINHASVTVTRDSDRKVIAVYVWKSKICKDSSLIPEAEAAIFAAIFTKSLLAQGVTSVQ